MNNKGFTLVELIVSIGLISIVMVFLFNLLGNVKREESLSNSNNTDSLNRSMIIRVIQNDFIELNLRSVNTCNVGEVLCYSFYFLNGTTKQLIVNKNNIIYDNEKWLLESGEYTSSNSVYCTNKEYGDNYYLKIFIPVINSVNDGKVRDIELIRIGKLSEITTFNDITC